MLFAEQPADTLQSEAVKNAQRYYQSCMRTADIIEQHTGPDGEVLTNIMNVIGWSWPIVFDDISPNLNLETWNFQDAFQKAHNVLNTKAGFFDWRIELVDYNNTGNRQHQIIVRQFMCLKGNK